MGAVAGPLISSTFMQHFGPDAMFGVTASVHLALAGFVFYRMRQRARAPEEEQVAFTESLALAQTVAPVDLAPTEDEHEAASNPMSASTAATQHTKYPPRPRPRPPPTP